jgi:hypothetical protein
LVALLSRPEIAETRSCPQHHDQPEHHNPEDGASDGMLFSIIHSGLQNRSN